MALVTPWARVPFLRDGDYRLVPRRQRPLAWPAFSYQLSGCAEQPVRRGLCKILLGG